MRLEGTVSEVWSVAVSRRRAQPILRGLTYCWVPVRELDLGLFFARGHARW